MNDDVIHTMPSYFVAAGHVVDPVLFANGQLRQTKRAISERLVSGGAVPAALVGILEVQLGDPDKPAGPAIVARVSGGAWMGKCECGGAELIDFDLPIFMCCACWNAEQAHTWRPVVLPDDVDRAGIEAILLARPLVKTRSWNADETVLDLIEQNTEHDAEVPLGDVAIEAAISAAQHLALAPVPPAPGGVVDGMA